MCNAGRREEVNPNMVPFASDGCFARICDDRFDVKPLEKEYSFLHVSHFALLLLPLTGVKKHTNVTTLLFGY